jgi:hypothetical protein
VSQSSQSVRPSAADNPNALLNRTHLRELGLERRAMDAASVLSRWSRCLATRGR